tara:strand:- start:1341 stop:1811 length:471 start_codon:yes stop_codon:yes gene_type:complete
MINVLEPFLTFENIYLVANWGVIPFWLMLILLPNNGFTNFLTNSVVAPLLLGVAYVFVAYNIYLEKNFFEGFNLYLGLDELYTVYSNEAFLLIFWLHFLSISLFIGSWITRDSQKYLVPRVFTILSLLITYFTGPLGLVFYWFIRIFFSKKIFFNE